MTAFAKDGSLGIHASVDTVIVEPDENNLQQIPNMERVHCRCLHKDI
jgi:hypothetical protein